MAKILVIEDNDTMREGICQILKRMGQEVFEAPSGPEGLRLFSRINPQLVITDYRMDEVDGIEVLRNLKPESGEDRVDVIVITAYGTIDLAVEAMKLGAADFITKPFSPHELEVKVQKVLDLRDERERMKRLRRENEYLRQEIGVRFNYGEIVGSSDRMQGVYRTIEKVADSDSSDLIYGESGTGKELVARAIHFTSRRAQNPFIRVNCGALAEGLLESELFGHEKGAFTGAIKRKMGRFELADKGTLFLDEIGDIPPNTQIRLIRVLQEKEFERVGGEVTISVDVRIIAATNKDLLERVEKGHFREDLYYRLHIIPIEVPPLRERKEDIPLLVEHFLNKIGEETNKRGVRMEEDAIRVLMDYDWPGNVRELENLVERALVLCDGDSIDPEDLPLLVRWGPGQGWSTIRGETLKLNDTLGATEMQLIKKALARAGGVKTEAARLLGIRTSALYYKLQKYGLIK